MPFISFQVISGKEYPIDVGAHRDAPLQVSDKSDQNLVKIFREITSVFK